MEQAVAFIAGASYLAIGLSFILSSKDWLGFFKSIQKHGRKAGLALGLFHLAIGSFILGFHWKWSGLPLLLSILGAKALFEGYIYTIFPGVCIKLLKWYEPYFKQILLLSGFITVLISLVFFYEWGQSYGILQNIAK